MTNPSQLREQLQEKVILELLGPAGGPEEIVAERSVRGRYLELNHQRYAEEVAALVRQHPPAAKWSGWRMIAGETRRIFVAERESQRFLIVTDSELNIRRRLPLGFAPRPARGEPPF